MSKVVELNVKGKPIKDKHSRVMLHEKIREKGRANMKWLEQNRLTENSMPAAWVNALLPLKKKPGDPAAMVSMEEWATYTNLRVLLSNAGSTLYPGDFQGFTPFEIRNYIGLYMLHGLSPSPQVKQKFWPQSVDPINGSDLCFKVFG